MRRFIRDPGLREFHATLQAEINRIGGLAEGRRYVTYLIRDPLQIDRRGNPDGAPIYVGQTKQMQIRARNHLEDGGRYTSGGRCKAGRLHEIMKRYRVPKFDILDEAPTHLTSLVSETVWARRLTYLGYDIANRWPEHRSRQPPEGLRSIPTQRLLDLTVEEAIEDEVQLELRCDGCGLGQMLDLGTLRPSAKLNLVHGQRTKCSFCEGHFDVRVVRPDFASWKWSGYKAAGLANLQ
jgi:hypothetical protein